MISDSNIIGRSTPSYGQFVTSRHLVQDLTKARIKNEHSKNSKRHLAQSGGRFAKSAGMNHLTSNLSLTTRKVAESALSQVEDLQQRQQLLERKVLVLLKAEGESRRINILELWRRVKEFMDLSISHKAQGHNAATNTDTREESRSKDAPVESTDRQDQPKTSQQTNESTDLPLSTNGLEYYIQQVVGSLRGSINAVDTKAESLRHAIAAVRRTALLTDAKCGAVAAEFVKLYKQVGKELPNSGSVDGGESGQVGSQNLESS